MDYTLADLIKELAPYSIPIVVIVCITIVKVVKMRIDHQERMSKMSLGINDSDPSVSPHHRSK